MLQRNKEWYLKDLGAASGPLVVCHRSGIDDVQP